MIARKLWPWERGSLREHLLRLGDEERVMRFCSPVGDAFINGYCDRIDWLRMVVVGAFVDGRLRGIAELIVLPQQWPNSAELAMSVERSFQRQGIGRRLIDQVLLAARNRLVREVYLISRPENEPMRRLARAVGTRFRSSGAIAEGRIGLPWPSYLSLTEEWASDGEALLGAACERTAWSSFRFVGPAAARAKN